MLCNLILDKNDSSFYHEESKTSIKSPQKPNEMKNKRISPVKYAPAAMIIEKDINEVEIRMF